MSQTVTVIGAGEIGRAMAKILQKKKELKIYHWNRTPLPNQKPLPETIPLSNFLFLCIPSWAVKETLGKINAHLGQKTIVISLAKGIEKGSLKTMNELLTELLAKKQRFSLLAGPMIAEELDKGLPGFGIIASDDELTFQNINPLFTRTNLNLNYTDDVRGVALGGVLKNIYAISLGIAKGLDWGKNAQGWLVAKILDEMLIIAEKLQAKKKTMLGLAGLGDLIATGFSPHSRNQAMGRELAKNGKPSLQGEGVVSLPSLLLLLKGKTDKLPILEALNKIIIENKKAKEIFSNLI